MDGSERAETDARAPTEAPPADPSPPAPRRPQPWPIRVTHWLNVVALVVMAGSGSQILVAFPSFGPQGAAYAWYPLQGVTPPEWLRLGQWLAGARALHFAFAWLLVGNGLLYLAYFLGSGEWRRRIFRPRQDVRGAWQMAAYYLRLRPQPPATGLYNPLQRFGYTAAIALGALEVLSGLALYKPLQLSWLAALFGGYDGARFVHFLGLVLLALFTIGHVVLVALHPRAMLDMVTGGKRS
jgi:Ni/Fe-hydrogenase b-type cytochrome subunit